MREQKKNPCATQIVKSQIGVKGSWIFRSIKLRWRYLEGRGDLQEPMVVDVGVQVHGLQGMWHHWSVVEAADGRGAVGTPRHRHSPPPPASLDEPVPGRHPRREEHEDWSEWVMKKGDEKAPSLPNGFRCAAGVGCGLEKKINNKDEIQSSI
jgi:hypothetical protein